MHEVFADVELAHFERRQQRHVDERAQRVVLISLVRTGVFVDDDADTVPQTVPSTHYDGRATTTADALSPVDTRSPEHARAHSHRLRPQNANATPHVRAIATTQCDALVHAAARVAAAVVARAVYRAHVNVSSESTHAHLEL
jgi:hypothetical protein